VKRERPRTVVGVEADKFELERWGRRGAQQAGATHVDQAHVERDGAAGRAAPEPVASSGLEDGSWEAS
jgi:hypothetical protein